MTIPNILTWLTFAPLIGAFVLMLLPRPKDLPEEHGDDHEDGRAGSPEPVDPARRLVNGVALLTAVAAFLISVVLFIGFRPDGGALSARNMQFLEDAPWFNLGGILIRYRMGVDGISTLLILLTTFLMVLSVLYSFRVRQRLKEFMVFLLLLETGMIGVFCALDLVLFYVFWEAMLIPMYFLIGIFGHENRIYAAVKFFIYTFAGSILMLIAIISVYQVAGTFDLLALSNHTAGAGLELARFNPHSLMLMFGAFSLAFMIKVPMFPFHTWLPDAHVEAPTAGSVLLAGVMLKMGTYGFLRFCLPLFPVQAQQSAPLFIALAITGIIYGSIVAAVQPDAKKLVAYSSVAHLGFVVLGIFTFTPVGMMGALIQNINHGISTPMLFFLVGMLYDRRHTRRIAEFGGLKLVVPAMATMLLIATLASIAVPFFNGFVGEFSVLLGSFTALNGGFWPTALASTGMILSAVYMLWWFQRLMLGPVTNAKNLHLPDLSLREWAVLTPLAGLVFWIGIGSTFWTQRMEREVKILLADRSLEKGSNATSGPMRRLDPNLPITTRLEAGYARDDRAIVAEELSQKRALERARHPRTANKSLNKKRSDKPEQRPIMMAPQGFGGPPPGGGGQGLPPGAPMMSPARPVPPDTGSPSAPPSSTLPEPPGGKQGP